MRSDSPMNFLSSTGSRLRRSCIMLTARVRTIEMLLLYTSEVLSEIDSSYRREDLGLDLE